MRRGLLTMVTLGGLAGAYYGTIGRHHHNEIARLNREIDAAYEAFERANAESAQTAALQQTVDHLEDWRITLRRRVQFDAAGSPALLAVRTALEQAGLTVEQAETLPVEPALKLPHQRMRVAVSGTFGNVFVAVQGIENSTPPTRVTDLLVRNAAAPGRVRAELVIVRTGSIE
jgi:hypothetical protein